MNKILSTLKSQDAEFDKHFGKWLCCGQDEFGRFKTEEEHSILIIKSFLSSSRIVLLESIVAECEEKKVKEVELFGTKVIYPNLNLKEASYNQALSDTISSLNEVIEKLK